MPIRTCKPFSRPALADALAHQSLITATCGLGLLPEAAAHESFRLADEFGEQVARIAP